MLYCYIINNLYNIQAQIISKHESRMKWKNILNFHIYFLVNKNICTNYVHIHSQSCTNKLFVQWLYLQHQMSDNDEPKMNIKHRYHQLKTPFCLAFTILTSFSSSGNGVLESRFLLCNHLAGSHHEHCSLPQMSNVASTAMEVVNSLQ